MKATIKPTNNEPAKTKILSYKIAFPTDDGQFIAGHFGRAAAFLVVEILEKKVLNKDLRPNDSHQGMPEHAPNHTHNHEHEHHDPEQQKTAHSRIADILYDVDIVIAKQMGPRAYDDLIANGFTVFLTDIPSIDEAIKAYLNGQI